MINKVVLTGSACSGKSTLIRKFSELGYPVIEESAREIILARSHIPLSEKEKLERQYMIILRQLEKEKKAEIDNKARDILFLDRSLIDSAAYSSHILGYIPNEIDNTVKCAKYDLVFILERLPFEKDEVRFEKDEEERTNIENQLILSYKDYGYNITRVPVMPLEERTDFVLSHVKKIRRSRE